MPLLEVRQVSRYYNAEVVLDEVDLIVEWGERVGLVGVNGSGKTTLCRIILGTEDLDGGTVTLARGAKVGYLAQEPVLAGDRTVWQEALTALEDLRALQVEFAAATEAIGEPDLDPAELERRLSHQSHLLAELETHGGFDCEQRLLATLGALGFTPADLERPARQLSGGEKSRLALARLLSAGCDLLLLDEPTNHLDIAMTEWLEGFLRGFRGGVIVVSHDRWFLDHAVNAIAELENGHITRFAFGAGETPLPPPADPEFQETAEHGSAHYGPYTHYLRVKAQRREADWRAYQAQQRELRKQEDWIRWKLNLRRGDHVRAARSRQKLVDKIERVERPADDLPVVKLRFEPRLRGPNEVATLERCAFAYPDGPELFGRVDLLVRRLDRVGIIGPNGCGKSSLLRVLRGELRPSGGRAWLGETADVGYYQQEHADLDLNLTPVEAIRAVAPALPLPQVRGYLARFLFFGDDVFRPLTTFSGGERSRLVLARLIIRRPNVLLLDEPTNHLDITSREVLEEALRGFHGTVLAVSHDRWFLERICRRLLVFEDGAARVFEGTYSELEAERVAQRQAAEDVAEADRRERQRAHVAWEREARRGKELRRAEQRKVTDLERRIEQVEAEIAALHERYLDPALYTDGQQVRAAQQEEAALRSTLEDLYTTYGELIEACSPSPG